MLPKILFCDTIQVRWNSQTLQMAEGWLAAGKSGDIS